MFKVIAGVILIIILDGVSAYLGIQANAAQNKGRHNVFMFVECNTNDHQKAYELGMAAAIALAVAHAVTNFVPCMSGKCSSKLICDTMGKVNAACLILSWLAFGFGATFFVQGANHNRGNDGYSCKIDLLKKHLLTYGVLASVVHAVAAGFFSIITGSISASSGSLGASRKTTY